MATVMGGVGIWSLCTDHGENSILISHFLQRIQTYLPSVIFIQWSHLPTTERLEQDKKTIDEQFDKAFALMEQLAKDTEALKMAEAERTQRLDGALTELETVISDVKSANRRRDDEAQRDTG